MIALKLVLQSLASTAAVGGIAFGSYKFMNADFDDFFLLVSVKDGTFSSQPTLDLISAKPVAKVPENTANAQASIFLNTVAQAEGTSSDGQTQTPAQVPETTETPAPVSTSNYKCTGSTINLKVEEDKNCELYSIPFEATKKSITLAKLKAFSENTTDANSGFTKTIEKSKLSKDKLFLLKTIKSLYSSWTYFGAETIKLMSNSDTEDQKTKSYAELTVHAHISSTEFSWKSNFIIAEYKKDTPASITVDAAGNTSTTSFECHIGEKATKKACVIKAFTTTTEPKTADSLTFSEITPSSAQAAETIEKDKFFFIKLHEEMKFSISDFENKNVVFIETKTTSGSPSSTTTTETELAIKASIFALPIATGAFDEVIILK